MNLFTPIIFGFGVADNSAVDDCVSAIAADNKLFNRSQFDVLSFVTVYGAMVKQLACNPEYGSLAIIGLVEHAIKYQLPISDLQLVSYEAAKTLDPLSKNELRKQAIQHMNRQLTAHINTFSEQSNEYRA